MDNQHRRPVEMVMTGHNNLLDFSQPLQGRNIQGRNILWLEGWGLSVHQKWPPT